MTTQNETTTTSTYEAKVMVPTGTHITIQAPSGLTSEEVFALVKSGDADIQIEEDPYTTSWWLWCAEQTLGELGTIRLYEEPDEE